ncbi:class I SAM-dependent methyltransferase [Microbacterium chocolatum]|uniref:class I SAM-dependent methyltransferase n=1 Tax=Microbacterium aurantiacum TaxID=162393 RepID=UPI00338F4D55
MTDDDLARSFGAVAGVYESGRPGYPLEVAQWVLEPIATPLRTARVVDLGAGTGKFTRVLRETGADVVAVDPDAAMLAELRVRVPGVPTFQGTAERMPLPDASVDAVVMAQAWHWVDPPSAAAEAGRVLRPSGALGLVWNIREESVEWVSALTTAMGGSHAEEMLAAGEIRAGAPIGPWERRTWRWVRTLTRSALLDMAASRSRVIAASVEERTAILDRVSDLFDAQCRQDGDTEVVDLPYRTEAFRAVRT